MISLICKRCNKKFEVRLYRKNTAKYCSKTCYDGNKLFKKCEDCGTIFFYSPSKERKCCTKACANRHRKTYIQEPKYANGFRAFWQRRGIIIKCEKCGYDEVKEILGIHHIDENRNNNKRENLMVLCPNCHSLIHRQHIPH